MNQLEQIVHQYIHLPVKPSPSGWFQVRCMVCDDHKHKKRGGWKFEGDITSYHCFNCGIKAVQSEQKSVLSPNMVKVLESFHVPSDSINQLRMSYFKTPKIQTLAETIKKNKNISEIKLPSLFVLLKDLPESNETKIKANKYIQSRGLELESYPFYVSKKGTTFDEKRWENRIIFPIFNTANQVIFYQGRDFTDSLQEKYLSSPGVSKGSVLYGLNQLFAYNESPLFITEGFFDSFLLNGVAIFGNELSSDQIQLINSSPRKKVVIPDRFGNGQILANQAIELGWNVSVLPFDDCKDVNDSFVKHGRLSTIKAIMDNISCGLQAEVNVRFGCTPSTLKKTGNKSPKVTNLESIKVLFK